MLNEKTKLCALLAASVALVALVGTAGCSPAEAGALEVTYYYLPG